MRPPRDLPRLAALLALATVLAAVPPARADAPVLHLAAAELRAGEAVELRWTGLPPGTEELEILLSLDDGRSYPLRVTAELEPCAGGFRWRVPNLAAARARLLLRYGERHRESNAGPTAPFRIVADPGAPETVFRYHEGAWWQRWEPAAAPAEGALRSPVLAGTTRQRDGAPPPAGAALAPPRRGGGRDLPPASGVTSIPRLRPSVPSVVPMRS
jgi:hypothetical protein